MSIDLDTNQPGISPIGYVMRFLLFQWKNPSARRDKKYLADCKGNI